MTATQGLRWAWRLGCALVLLAGVLFAPARADAAAPGKQMLGAVPHQGAPGGVAAPFASPLAPGFDLQPIPGPLLYHRGRVLHTNAVRTIYWIPAGYGVSPGYQALVDGFLANVAADSGRTGNVYASDTQYFDSTFGRIQYSTAFLGGTVDTNPFPVDATTFRTECYTGGACLTDTELVNEIEAVKAANGWSGGLDMLYVILTPRNVNICVDWAPGVPCSTNTFCAYHSWDGLSSNPAIIYAVEPYFPIGEPGCDGGEHPNGNDADLTINTLSHEHNEAITDPTFGGWYDAQGEENGDKCAFNFGARLGTTGLGRYNQVINGSFYFLQREWSNALNGCFQVDVPTVTGLSTLSAPAGADVGITGANFFFPDGVGSVTFNGHASPFVTVDSPTHLTARVPGGAGVSGRIAVQAVGGVGASAQVFGVQPAVSGFTPGSGFAGQAVTVTGTGFFGVTAVKFNGVAAVAGAVTADGTSLTATVPVAATSGKISITTAGGTGQSAADFTVLPRVTGFVPAAAVAGGNVTVLGTGFSGTPTVQFAADGGSVPATLVSHTATALVVQVPPTAINGPITVTTGDGASSSATPFKPLPKLTGFAGEPALAGGVVTVNGANLTAAGALTARLGTVAISPDSLTATSFTFTVPDNGLTGAVAVTNANGTAASPTVAHVKPTINALSTSEGPAGAHVQIGGKTFTGTTAVRFFNNVPAFFTVGAGGTTLDVTVPAAAATGPISVTNTGGTSTSGTFTVDPKVTVMAPLAGVGGSNVTLAGTGLAGTTEVEFAGASGPATIVSNTSTAVVATVPADALNGPVTVHVGPLASQSPTVFKPLPKLAGFVGEPALAGDVITVNGSNLTAGSTLTARLGTVAVGVDSLAATSFQVTVPDTATTGFVSVANANGTATSSAVLHVKPTISGDPVPSEAAAGAHVVLTGKTFTGTSAVRFGDNTEPAVFVVGVGGTTLTVTVPPNATTGKIGVTNAGGTVSTTNDFLVDPKVTGFVPLAAVAGGNVTVLGTGFSGVPAVTFTDGGSGAAATVVSHTATGLVVQVPPTAVNGPITVTTAAGSSASAGVFRPVPKLTGFVGDPALAGDVVTVNGSNLTAGGTLTARLGTVAVGVDSLAATSFQVTVPDTATTGFVSIANANGAANSPAPLRVKPTITGGATPDHAPAGAQVTLTGKTFTGASAVKFGDNTEPAVFVVGAGGTTLTATVPPNATTGKIGVTNAGGTALTSLDFAVLPRVAGFVPVAATAGTNVTIQGTGFSGTPTVEFAADGGPVAATVVSHTATGLVVQVPPTAVNGPITVTTAAGSSASTGAFKPLPKLTGFLGDPAVAGDLVTVTGANLTAGGALSAKLGAIAVAPGSITPTSFQLTVPDTATTGFVSIANANGTANSPAPLRVKPTITGGPTPDHAPAGAQVTLTGKTFAGTSAVKFGDNTEPAVFVVGAGGTTLTATVPPNATTGKIGVTNAGGTALTSLDFTPLPHISTFAPRAGGVGTGLTINGTGLAGVTSVDFGGGVSAVPDAAPTSTSVHVVVPPGAASGPLTVHSGAETSASATAFNVNFSVTGISPTSGVYGTHVTLTGVGLLGVTQVKFNGVPGAIASNTGTAIDATVPASGDVSGPVAIWVGAASISAPQQFTLLSVGSLGVAAGFGGNDLTITGTGFAGATSVHIGSVAALIVSNDGTHIHVSIPDTATTGAVTVTGPGGTATGPSLTVRAGLVLDEVAPNVASGGTNVVELYATTAGEVGGVTLVQNPGSDDLVVATLPSFTVAKGDLVVIHLGTSATAPTHTGAVWELAAAGDVTYGDAVLELRNGATVMDAVPFVDPALAVPAAFLTSVNSLGGNWPACGSCTAAAAGAASVDWSHVGTTPTGATAQRDFGTGGGGDTNASADWSVHPGTLGAANR
jgi:hypothetical protein